MAFNGLTREQLPRDPCNILRGAKIAHSLPLVSAYAAVHDGKEPEFTNYTGDFVGCLDYMWISADRLGTTAFLEIPPVSELTRYSGTPLPNPQYPSDHVALVFDLVPTEPR